MNFIKSLVLIIYIMCIVFIFLNKPKKLNKAIIERIKNEGIIHVTNKKNVKLIMDNYGYANLKAAPKIKCYGSWFKSAVFFFLGEPSTLQYRYNINFKKKNDYAIIRILPENIDNEILKLLRWRRIDKAIIHLGDLKIKAKVENFKIYK